MASIDVTTISTVWPYSHHREPIQAAPTSPVNISTAARHLLASTSIPVQDLTRCTVALQHCAVDTPVYGAYCGRVATAASCTDERQNTIWVSRVRHLMGLFHQAELERVIALSVLDSTDLSTSNDDKAQKTVA